jgi:hypothetical protein
MPCLHLLLLLLPRVLLLLLLLLLLQSRQALLQPQLLHSVRLHDALLLPCLLQMPLHLHEQLQQAVLHRLPLRGLLYHGLLLLLLAQKLRLQPLLLLLRVRQAAVVADPQAS